MKTKIIDRKNYTIFIDKMKNRVYFQPTNQIWRLKDMDFLLLDWKEIIAQMQRNFTILSDIRNLQIQSPRLDKLHEEIQKYVTENGLLKVARDLADNDIVNLQFGRIAERSLMPNNVFYTIEDAERYLDRIAKEFEELQENNRKK